MVCISLYTCASVYLKALRGQGEYPQKTVEKQRVTAAYFDKKFNDDNGGCDGKWYGTSRARSDFPCLVWEVAESERRQSKWTHATSAKNNNLQHMNS